MKSDRPLTETDRLDPPGAGLPLPELWIARLWFRRFRRAHSRQALDAIFDSERANVLELAASVPVAEASRPVLIRRLRGLEDSSRSWSVFMTVEHLRIVNVAVAAIVRALGRGESPGGEVSTAAVKPAAGIGEGVLDAFDQSCALLTTAFAGLDALTTERRHPHPWFGALDAAGWHALSAMHTRLHRAQIGRIVAGLGGG